jgi:hypothetical protein
LSAQIIRGSPDRATDLDPGIGQRVEQIPFGCGLGGQPVDELEEGRTWIRGIAKSSAFSGKAPQPVVHYCLEQGLLRGEVTVNRAGPDASASGDLVEWN